MRGNKLKEKSYSCLFESQNNVRRVVSTIIWYAAKVDQCKLEEYLVKAWSDAAQLEWGNGRRNGRHSGEIAVEPVLPIT